MNVKVRLFASYAEQLGRTELALELPEGAIVGDALRAVTSLSGGSTLPVSPLVAVNCTYAKSEQRLANGDEVALIPPVAGG